MKSCRWGDAAPAGHTRSCHPKGLTHAHAGAGVCTADVFDLKAGPCVSDRVWPFSASQQRSPANVRYK